MQPRSRVLFLDTQNLSALVNYGIKAGLFVAFFVAIVVPPDAVAGKAMGFRAPLFLASAILVPLLAKVRNWNSYPHTGDAILASPFLVDTLGNLFGFYDRYGATDDVLHVVNWVLLVAAYHAFRFRNVFDNREAILLGYGFGAIAIVWWEIMEWAVSEDGWGGAGALSLTYSDTIGDLLLSSSGGLVGSIVGLLWFGPGLNKREVGSLEANARI